MINFKKIKSSGFKVILSLLLLSSSNLIIAQHNNQIQQLVKSTDKIVIIKFNGKSDTMHYEITDKKGIAVFTDILQAKNINQKHGKKIGEIKYYSKNKLLLSLTRTENGIVYTHEGKSYFELITYEASMYFIEIWNMKLIDSLSNNE